MRLASLVTLGLLAATPALAQSYVVDQVVIQGAKSVPADQLRAAIPIQNGQRVTRDDIIAGQNALEKALEAKHVTGGIKTSMASKPGNHITIIYALNDTGIVAPQVVHQTTVSNPVLANTVVTGNKHLATDKVIEAANLQPGQELTEQVIRDAAQRILAAYKEAQPRISVGIAESNTVVQGNKVTLTWTLTEKPMKRNTEDLGGQSVDQ